MTLKKVLVLFESLRKWEFLPSGPLCQVILPRGYDKRFRAEPVAWAPGCSAGLVAGGSHPADAERSAGPRDSDSGGGPRRPAGPVATRLLHQSSLGELLCVHLESVLSEREFLWTATQRCFPFPRA